MYLLSLIRRALMIGSLGVCGGFVSATADTLPRIFVRLGDRIANGSEQNHCHWGAIGGGFAAVRFGEYMPKMVKEAMGPTGTTAVAFLAGSGMGYALVYAGYRVKDRCNR
jgi:hypothetical protein